MLSSVADQVSFLSQHLTGWGNWRIAELDTVVFTVMRLPFLPRAAELLDLGTTGMRNALATQFLPDGVHVERTPGYHQWMAQVLASYYDLAKRFPEADAHVDPEILIRALDYAAQSDLCGINDSSAAPSRSGAAARREIRAPRSSRACCRSAISAPPRPWSRSSLMPARSSYAPDGSPAPITWPSTPAPGAAGTATSAASPSSSARPGGSLLADPGVLTYEMSDPLGPYGKSTVAHSTLSVNGWNQSEADAHLLRTEFTPLVSLIHARYQGGYWPVAFGWSFGDGHGRGAHGTHDRVLLWVKGEYLLALDAIRADRDLIAHNCWQMGPMDRWSADPKRLTWRSHNADANLLLQFIPFQDDPVEMQCFEGSKDPLRGWVCHHHHDATPAPLVEFRYPAHPGGAASAALIVPFAGAEQPSLAVIKSAVRPWAQLRHLEIALPNGSVDHIAWSHGLSAAVDDEPFVTDAPFVWLRTERERRSHGGIPARRKLPQISRECRARGARAPVGASPVWVDCLRGWAENCTR